MFRVDIDNKKLIIPNLILFSTLKIKVIYDMHDLIIPSLETKYCIQRKETKQKETKRSLIISFLLVKRLVALSQSGICLSIISQYFIKKSNHHLRQVLDFKTGVAHVETKDNYKVFLQHFNLL